MKLYIATGFLVLFGGIALMRWPTAPSPSLSPPPAAGSEALAPLAVDTAPSAYAPIDTTPPQVPSAHPSRAAAIEERATQIIVSTNLEPDLWRTYTAMGSEALATAMKDVRATYDSTKERTDALTTARKAAIDAGDYQTAQRLLDEMAPLFEERHRLSSRLMVAALAKAAGQADL
jgi:thioredoxin-like negative regulator of GroEL